MIQQMFFSFISFIMHNGDYVWEKKCLEVNTMYNFLLFMLISKLSFWIFSVDSSAKANSVTHGSIYVSSWKLAYPLASQFGWVLLFCFSNCVVKRETCWTPKGHLFQNTQIISLLLSEEEEKEDEEEREGRKW